MKDVVVTVYIDNKPNIITEFGWLYKSWLFSHSDEASDIVAFHHPKIAPESLPEHKDITYIPLAPLTEIDSSWAHYPFINSIWFLTTPEASKLLKYKYIFRTDNDCFLTPYFPTLQPRLATFGIGWFAVNPEVVIRLAEISKKWGIGATFNSVGSAFMIHSENALRYNALQFDFCDRLRKEEFPDGVGEWPGWWYGVLSMYAGQLAANAYFGGNVTLSGVEVHPSSQDVMCATDYHIHAFHTWDYFSKLAWRRGDYKDYDMSSLDKTRIADYCLLIAGVGPI